MTHGHHRKLLQAGSRIAEFKLKRIDGKETSLADITAQGPALLVFFKVNCPVCQLTFPYLERIQRPGRLPVYGISQNCLEDTQDFNRHFGITFPTLLDTEAGGFPVSNAFGISSVPTLFVVEADGVISHVTEGWHKAEMAQLGARAGINPFRPGDSVPEAKSG